MFWEKKLEHWAASIRDKLVLPLRVELWNGQHLNLSHLHPEVIVRVPHVSALTCLFTPSLSNLGAAYVDGKIDVEGKPGAIISVGNALASGTLKLEGKFSRIIRKIQRSKDKDKAAIQYHYDVSNAFYQLWLDENLVYSCAYFENGDEDLNLAQVKKMDLILQKIHLQPGDTLLDIGCGWGALVIHAAQHYGARCVGITLSENQASFARTQVMKLGLSNLIDIRLQDYRDVQGTFDKITSVGMFEHVGVRNLPDYFAKINSLLSEDGVVMNHGITSTDAESGETPYGNGEFIEKYVFPHGELPHIGLALKAMQEGGLEVLDIENLRSHYAQTCTLWVERFEANADKVKQISGDRRYRIWRVYLAGCAYAFNQDWISLFQVVCVKAGRLPQRMSLPDGHRYGRVPLKKSSAVPQAT
ncbi:class I SAM-dependent methyltransferase [Undibacterium jejuense]|uniref:Class I SAM-dependent methyltransferase n=1 Tax=Undibacterium jejuense TaxID=1344949 RepID=A0A923HR84_9BURK|nr:cyclopropane-fatty-acyl-phospholipid synthase family protein [Undibacterium jejuense]MBC3863228.1 class I SAM-dependent methyltransferase [Undibacterium jejuense]